MGAEGTPAAPRREGGHRRGAVGREDTMKDDLRERLAALTKAGATPQELRLFLMEQQAAAFSPPARDATNQPFLTGADASAAHQQSAQAGMSDAGNMALSGANAATFGLADEVVPGMKGAIQEFQGQKPGLDQIAQILGSLAGPGSAGVGALKAIAPTTMIGQVATGAGLGAANSFLNTAGNTEGGLAERAAAGVQSMPSGAGMGALVGAVPGATVGAMKLRGRGRLAVAAGRTTVRGLQGKLPLPSDVMAMMAGTPADDLATLMAKV